MAHAKQQVREAFSSVLSAIVSAHGPIRQTRMAYDRKVGDHTLVYVESEEVESLGIEPGHLQKRVMLVAVRGRLRDIDREADENRADDYAVAVETSLTHAALNTALANKLHILELESTALDQVEDEKERTYLEVALDFRVQVHTHQGSPETLI